MNIYQATASYEAWMKKCTSVVQADLREKHKEMKQDPYYFLRGTYYHWAAMWPKVCPGLAGAPKILASGDLHVGSFGTWRDAEGRMCWGVDDFDEAYPLPYTNDLVRLAASVKIVTRCEQLTIKFKIACDAILEGYATCLKEGGHPLVLAERERNLERFGIAAIDPPQDFWEKLAELPTVSAKLPSKLGRALEDTLPPGMQYRVVRRKAGVGSRGQQRFVAIATWKGGYVAREAKAMLPSASVWLEGRTGKKQNYYQQLISGAVRSHDPFQKIKGSWLIRRLSPDSNPIEISELTKQRDEEILLQAMGCEVANVHLATSRATKNILHDIRARKANWLRSAAKEMAKAVEKQWQKYVEE